ncbi:AGAP009709-PA [Anopheles gambiae str. PEST]|uniref:AGAP009709-PA n=1 Tax=Anopheles gambiae TaxID=7165 RepID=Q5TP87_ANOGA|nr:AGAP009709-PA [Anopheles gambiae str. PEST]
MPPSIGTFRDKVKATCPTCNHPTEKPAGPGGIGKLPQHFVLARKIENIILQHLSSPGSSRHGSPTNFAPSSIAFARCELCSDEDTLSNFYGEAHRRQPELMKVRTRLTPLIPREGDSALRSIKCLIHPEQKIKLFCTTCHQVICGECSTLLHQDY